MNNKDFKPGIGTRLMHQMGLTFGGIIGLNIGYAMDLLVDTLDLALVAPTVTVRDTLKKQVEDLKQKTEVRSQ